MNPGPSTLTVVRSPRSAESSPVRSLTPGQRWKFRRNLVIVIAHQNGVSQRLLADVFDLPHGRIAAIVREFRDKDRSEALRHA